VANDLIVNITKSMSPCVSVGKDTGCLTEDMFSFTVLGMVGLLAAVSWIFGLQSCWQTLIVHLHVVLSL